MQICSETAELLHRLKARTWHDYFAILGVRPILGRTFLPEEDRPGSDDVVVISDAFWKRALGGDPAICGKTIRIDSHPNRVVGVVRWTPACRS